MRLSVPISINPPFPSASDRGVLPRIESSSEIVNSALVRRGLATVIEGRLVPTVAALDALGDHIQRKRCSDEDRKNVKWTGPIIFALASMVARELEAHGALPNAKAIYRDFLRAGHRISIGQFRYGVGIFAACTTPIQVHETLQSHRSVGEWWNTLSDQQKAEHVLARREAQLKFWARLTPEEREIRRASSRHAIIESARTFDPATAEKLERADSLAQALKALENRLEPGTAVHFAGVTERMRSSWEALFARVVQGCKDRFYIYEPMGFPLMDPATKRIEIYHPDFFDFKIRGTHNVVRVVEIKGVLTETGRRKIEMFQKLYLENDFSPVPPEKQPLMKHLVETAKANAKERFHVTIGRETRFKVFGDLYWRASENNFVTQNKYERSTDTPGRGLIPRLAKHFPHLVPDELAPALSGKAVDKELTKLSLPHTALQAVAPIAPQRIGQSLDAPLTVWTVTRLYALMYVLHETLQKCVEEGLLRMKEDSFIITTQNMGPYMDLVSGWQVLNREQRARAYHRLESRLGTPESYMTVYFGSIYLKLVEQTMHPNMMFHLSEAYDHEQALFATLRMNAARLGDMHAVLERKANKKIGMSNEYINRLKTRGLKHASDLVVSFAQRYQAGTIELDIPYIAKQFGELLQMGSPTVTFIRPTPKSSTLIEHEIVLMGGPSKRYETIAEAHEAFNYYARTIGDAKFTGPRGEIVDLRKNR